MSAATGQRLVLYPVNPPPSPSNRKLACTDLAPGYASAAKASTSPIAILFTNNGGPYRSWTGLAQALAKVCGGTASPTSGSGTVECTLDRQPHYGPDTLRTFYVAHVSRVTEWICTYIVHDLDGSPLEVYSQAAASSSQKPFTGLPTEATFCGWSQAALSLILGHLTTSCGGRDHNPSPPGLSRWSRPGDRDSG